ncbi:MAG: hypothetical protein JWO85_2476, partial [Candidatus Eremiobacteraeota bacterium]|nr:hypothetical protein [Candidatus Eremiobacteraeota bacterium]
MSAAKKLTLPVIVIRGTGNSPCQKYLTFLTGFGLRTQWPPDFNVAAT